MKEVTKEEFYKRIENEKLNVHPTIVSEYPYAHEFRFPSGLVWGKVIPSEINKEKYPYPWYVEHYFIL